MGSAHAGLVTANAAQDFAVTQGNNGWNYGFAEIAGNSVYRSSDFRLFSYAENILNYTGLNGWTTNPSSYAMITPTENGVLHLHPSNLAWTILRYDVTSAGKLSTNFTFGRLNPSPYGSINARVYLNGQALFGGNDLRVGQSFSSSLQAMVKQGDKLDFVIDANGNPDYDGSSLQANVTIAPVPEPETYALMGVGLLGLLAARRKAKQA